MQRVHVIMYNNKVHDSLRAESFYSDDRIIGESLARRCGRKNYVRSHLEPKNRFKIMTLDHSDSLRVTRASTSSKKQSKSRVSLHSPEVDHAHVIINWNRFSRFHFFATVKSLVVWCILNEVSTCSLVRCYGARSTFSWDKKQKGLLNQHAFLNLSILLSTSPHERERSPFSAICELCLSCQLKE